MTQEVAVNRPVALLGAPSSIGIRPYDNGLPRRLGEGPGALRALGLAARVCAQDWGDVVPAPYQDFIRPPGGVRNEKPVGDYSRAIAQRVAAVVDDGRFALVVGGDCSIVLGGTWGARRAARGPIGLAYIDGHADFGTPEESRTGSAASMCLALAVGRGDTPLARLDAAGPLVDPANVVLIGRRDLDEPWYGHEALRRSGALDLPDAAAQAMGWDAAAAAALERLVTPELAGFWVHLDVDVLDPRVMPAVDSPVAGGPGFDELAALLLPLVRHPNALGMEVTIYDPALDPDRSAGERLVGLLERLLYPSGGLT
jgi:arginase